MSDQLLVILAAGAIIACVVGLGVLVLRRGGSQGGEVAGRLAHLAEMQQRGQEMLAERLQAQERIVTKLVEERLEGFGKRVSDRMSEAQKESQTVLTDLRTRLAVIDKAQEKITTLSSDIVGLQDILSNKQTRGAFGEIQLRDIVQMILPPSAYSFQETLSTRVRVDCLLKLPNPPGSIGIDAKFPLESYEALRAGTDGAEKIFATDIRRHVAAIADKYIIPGETAECALMFLPSEAVYAELHANHRAVVEESYRRRVWIVSPTTLMATLNTVRAVLKDVTMREQAHLIQAEVGKLVEDVERLATRASRLQTHFNQAEEDVRQITISSDKIAKRGERIQEVEVEAPVAVVDPLLPGT